jgi:SAM-dependent methyltransferase
MSGPPPTDRDYVFGTHDEEIARLGLQHRVWRPRATDAWRRAGFTSGQTLLDVGCGPGLATIDLAEIVGPRGRIVAIDRSRRFLDAVEASARSRGLDNIATHEADLDEGALPGVAADGAWIRWVLAFVKAPRQLLNRIAAALKPGAVLVVHEYFHYATWRFVPRSKAQEEFVTVVTEAWRAEGGEPDVGHDLPVWLGELGFEIRSLLPIVDVIRPTDYAWQWPKSFVEVGVRRLVDLGRLSPESAAIVSKEFAALEAAPHTLMITPAVMEILAVKR